MQREENQLTTELTAQPNVSVRVVSGAQCVRTETLARWGNYIGGRGDGSLSGHPGWLAVFAEGLRHEPYCIEAVVEDRIVGILPLAYVRSLLFGRFLVSLPYINSAGIIADDPAVAIALIDRAVTLADELNVRYLELRHEEPLEHPALGARLTSKVHMRLALPESADELWKRFDPKVRNQIRKGEKNSFEVAWGGEDVLREFYDVFSRNMRDLGTPVFGRKLFSAILATFPDNAELCVTRLDGRAVASALLVHGPGTTEVPSASSLRQFNLTNANMLMYWHLLQRAIAREQRVFDFGRSTIDGNTYRFKKQWGAEPNPAVWQYYVRRGNVGDMRIEGGNYDRMIRLWQRLPVWLTRLIGPTIVRGIP
ncbi:MAG: FemAB family XrtA/PEP-CTERM system-associated protein [Pirellulaceae bacterium]